MTTPLEAPDPRRCQADVPNKNTFMTMGGTPTDINRVRCTNKPTIIVTERIPDDNGLCGSMSLCKDCLTVFFRQDAREVDVTVLP